MTQSITRRNASLLIATLAGTTLAGTAKADDVVDARHVLDEAAITVQRVRDELKDSSDMDDLLQRSKGVLIVPAYYKLGFIVGGAYGDGVLMKRLPDGGFGDPAFYRWLRQPCPLPPMGSPQLLRRVRCLHAPPRF